MKKEFNSLSVDAGCIVLMDEEYLESNGGKFDNSLTKKVVLAPGKYEIGYRLPNTWNGKVVGRTVLDIKSGNLIVGDSCYNFKNHKKWSMFLDETDFLKNMGTFGHQINTGGDGGFDIELTIVKVDEKEKNPTLLSNS